MFPESSHIFFVSSVSWHYRECGVLKRGKEGTKRNRLSNATNVLLLFFSSSYLLLAQKDPNIMQGWYVAKPRAKL